MKRSCPEAELRPRPAAAEAAADFKLRPVVRFATQDVFNLPISEAFLVLDVRGPALYRASHLHSAWCAEEALGASLLLPPACMDGSDPSGVVRDRLLNLLDFIGDENPPEQLDTVVVCCSPGQDVSALTQELAALRHEDIALARVGYSFGAQYFRRLGRVAVFDGTETLSVALPFLTATGATPNGPGDERVPILPAMIRPPLPAAGRAALYLGSQTHAGSAEALRLLGIRAVVNATTADMIPNHFEGEASAGAGLPAVLYLRCSLLDDDEQPLGEACRASHAFIEAHGCGVGVGTMVHCSRGKNRSAALVAHHLLAAADVTHAEEALAVLRKWRPGALSNENFVGQLRALYPAPGDGEGAAMAEPAADGA